MITIQSSLDENGKLAVRSQSGIIVLKHGEILYLEGEGRYTKIYLKNGQTIFVARLLKSFEDALPGNSFFRIHKSFLINISSVKELRTHNNPKIFLENNIELNIARRRKSGLIKCLSSNVAIV